MAVKEGKYVWMNGQMIPTKEAKIHPLSPAGQYGLACFEGIRCYKTARGTAIFRLQDHLKRLEHSAKTLGMTLDYSLEELTRAMKETILINGMPECYIRPWVGFGYEEDKKGLKLSAGKIDIMIAVWEWSYFGATSRAKVSNLIRPHPQCAAMTAKISGTYVNSMLSMLDIKGYDDAILLDHAGHVAEVEAANIFIVDKEGNLVTPKSESILPGLTRDTVIKIAKKLGYRANEEQVSPWQLYNAKEVFLCGTAAEITPVVLINYDNVLSVIAKLGCPSCKFLPSGEKNVGNGEPGPIALQFKDLYKKVVTGQIPEYDHWLEYV